MKKALILALIILVPFLIGFKTNASIDPYFVTEESKNLIYTNNVVVNDDNEFLSQYTSTGYYQLRMGYSNNFIVYLSNLENVLEFYDESNISNIYLEFEFGTYYTGVSDDDDQWLSSDSNWDSVNEHYLLDIDSLPLSISFDVYWNIIGQSGGAPSIVNNGVLRLYSVKIHVDYTNPIDNAYTLSSFDELPETSGTIFAEDYNVTGQVGSVEFFQNNLDPNKNDFVVSYDDTFYRVLGITLPDEQINLNRAFYFTENGTKYMFFFLDNPVDEKYSYHLAISKWLVWNLETGEYVITSDVTLYGKLHSEGDGISSYNKLFMDLVVPFGIDDLMSIIINYDYRYHYFVGDPGQWISVKNQTLLKNETTNVELPWWIDVFGLYNSALLNSDNFIANYLAEDQIKDITSSINQTYRTDFVTYMQENGLNGNYTESNIFKGDYSVYEIFLGQFSKYGSNGIQAKNAAIVNMRYVDKGIEYSLPYPKADIPDQPNPSLPNIQIPTFKEILDYLGDWIYLIIIVVVILLFSLIGKLERTVKSAKRGAKFVFSPVGLAIIALIVFAILLGLGGIL
ncbi:MAG: hypothetical protein RBQ91_02170 [Acholeplasma sp.]|nr:hypothetical protein [Acholeplasma sp.]